MSSFAKVEPFHMLDNGNTRNGVPHQKFLMVHTIFQCWSEMERRLGGEVPEADSPAQKHFDKGNDVMS